MVIMPFNNQRIKYYSQEIPSFDECDVVAYILYELGISKKTLLKWFKGRINLNKNGMIYYHFSDPSYKYIIKDINKNVRWFLKHKKPIKFDNVTRDFLVELLASQMTNKEIAQESKVPLQTINDLRNNKKSLYSLNESTVDKLCELYVDNKKWISQEMIYLDLKTYYRTRIYDKGALGLDNKSLIVGPTFTMLLSYNKSHNPMAHTAKIVNLDLPYVQKIPKQVLKDVKTYANQPKCLDVFSDSVVMSIDLRRKQQSVVSLDACGHSRKYICKRLKLNKYFVNLVLDNKFTGKVNFK